MFDLLVFFESLFPADLSIPLVTLARLLHLHLECSDLLHNLLFECDLWFETIGGISEGDGHRMACIMSFAGTRRELW